MKNFDILTKTVERQKDGDVPVPQIGRNNYGGLLEKCVKELQGETRLTQKRAGLIAEALFASYQLGRTFVEQE